jgi:hypothetical protein
MVKQEEKIVGLTVEELHQRREELKKFSARAEALTRLQNNADFKLVITDGYMEDEAIRLVHLLGDARFNSDDKKAAYREDFQERMIGIARLSEYFRSIFQLSGQAQRELDELNQAETEFYNKG